MFNFYFHYRKVLLAAFATQQLLFVNTAFAQGGQDGGGGNVIRCEAESQLAFKTINGRKAIVKVPPRSLLPDGREYQLVDLWELENRYGTFQGQSFTLVKPKQASKQTLLAYAFNRLNAVSPELAIEIQKHHAHIITRMQEIPADAYVRVPEDTDIRFLPRGCSLKGFGYYSDRADNLVYDAAVMAKLPAIDLAAFEVHEAVYRYLRLEDPLTSSWDTRRVVGLLFANEPFTLKQLTEGFR